MIAHDYVAEAIRRLGVLKDAMCGVEQPECLVGLLVVCNAQQQIAELERRIVIPLYRIRMRTLILDELHQQYRMRVDSSERFGYALPGVYSDHDTLWPDTLWTRSPDGVRLSEEIDREAMRLCEAIAEYRNRLQEIHELRVKITLQKEDAATECYGMSLAHSGTHHAG